MPSGAKRQSSRRLECVEPGKMLAPPQFHQRTHRLQAAGLEQVVFCLTQTPPSSPASTSDSECEGVRSASVRTTQAVADSWKLKDGNGFFKTIRIEEPGSPSLAPHLPMRCSPGMTDGGMD